MAARHAAEQRRVSWRVVAVLVGVFAVLAAASAVGVHQACQHADPPVEVPTPGTPRASYCGAAQALPLWVSLVVLPSTVAFAVLMTVRRRARWVATAFGVLLLVLLANVIVVFSLEHSTTI